VCLIVDANVASIFLAQQNAVTDWLLGKSGRLVAAGKLRLELAKNDVVRRLLVRLDQAGRLRSADANKLEQEEQRLRTSATCVSNDPHVLALAIVSGARTLATEDQYLIRDFRNEAIIDQPRGNIYRNPAVHGRLLRHTASCGVDDRRGARHTGKL